VRNPWDNYDSLRRQSILFQALFQAGREAWKLGAAAKVFPCLSSLAATPFGVRRGRMPSLKVFFRGDPFMVNVYHGLCQPPGATCAATLGAKFVAFLASEKAQQILRNFGKHKYGQALYGDANYARQYE